MHYEWSDVNVVRIDPLIKQLGVTDEIHSFVIENR